jgi:protein involved in polysaccharide export with SLBB domain
MGLGLLTGCESLNFNPLETKSWLDPSELAGRANKDTLQVKILDKIDPVIEADSKEFVTAQPPVQDDLVVNASDYVINPNDMLSIEISDLGGPGTQTVKTSRVTESGTISLPFVGQLKAAGMTEYELEQTIVEAYRKAGILQRAQVSVSVPERRGAVFDILGSVGQPGQYALIDPDTRVLNAITIAREQTSTQLTDVYIIRRTDMNRPSRGRGATQPADGAPPPRPGGRGADDLRPQGMLQTPGGAQRAALLRDHAPRAATARMKQVAQPVAGGDELPLLLADTAPQPGSTGGRDENGPYTIIDGKKYYHNTTAAGATAPAGAGAADLVPPPGAAPVPDTAPPTPTASTPAAGSGTTAGGTAAGGFAGFRDLSAPENVRIIHIPLDRLRAGELQYNIVIKPKDIIIIQPLPVGTYYMGGHVGQPGAYSLTQSRVTLKQAVISARMLDQLAIPERTDIIRRIGKDKEVYVRVNLAKIFEGTAPDFYLKADDQVIVGTNMLAPFIAAIRGAFRLTYGFGFLYDRNFAAEQNNKISN